MNGKLTRLQKTTDNMKSEVLSSATKIVLLWIMFVLGFSTLLAVIFGLWRGTVDPVDLIQILGFNSVIGFVTGFYFSKRSDTPTPEGTIVSQETNTKVTTVKPESPVTTE